MIFPRNDDAETSPSDNVMVYCFNCYKVLTILILATTSYTIIIETGENQPQKLVDKIYSYKNQRMYVGVNVST